MRCAYRIGKARNHTTASNPGGRRRPKYVHSTHNHEQKDGEKCCWECSSSPISLPALPYPNGNLPYLVASIESC